MTNKLVSDGSDFIFNGNKTPYKIDGMTVMEFTGNKWKVVKKCQSYSEAINLLRKLQGRSNA